jgi:hypothetical protein
LKSQIFAALTAATVGTACLGGVQAQSKYRIVDALDLGVGSKKYIGKDIEMQRVRCYYADVDDYRCITNVPVSIFTKKIEPEIAKDWIEENCDTLKKTVESRKCLVDIRFNLTDLTQDIIDGYQQRTVLLPSSVEVGLRADPDRRDRRRH